MAPGLVLRCRIALAGAEGLSNTAVAGCLPDDSDGQQVATALWRAASGGVAR